MFPLIKANVDQFFTFALYEKRNWYREQDLSHLRKLIVLVELPALYFCADNHHTHELEMTTNKLISDQGIMLVFTRSLS